MARIEKSARETVATATEAVNTAAEAVRVGRQAVRTAKKAGSQAKGVAKQAFDKITGREAARRQKHMGIAAGVAGTALMAGVVAARVRKGRKH